VAVLATAAQYFDVLCERTMGTSLGSVSLLLIVGLINSCIRQVCLIQPKCLCLLRPAQIRLQKHASYMFWSVWASQCLTSYCLHGLQQSDKVFMSRHGLMILCDQLTALKNTLV